MSEQLSKRQRAITKQRVKHGVKLTGKTHSHQRKHREKMHGTREGWEEHQKRQERRQTERHRIHKMQNRVWNGG